jgi:ABC-2 type transport system permease protein
MNLRLSPTFSAFIAMSKKQLIVMTRYPVELLSSFGQVFLLVLMFTLATVMFTPGGLNSAAQGGSGIGGVIMYGFVLFMFLSDTIWTIGYSIRWEQYEGTLESLYLTPASKLASLISRTIVTLTWTGANVAAALVFVQFVIGRLPFQNAGLGLYLLVFTLMGTFGMGFAFAAYTLLVKESAQSTANLLQFFFLAFCAMFFPFSSLPSPLLLVSRLIPLSYSVDAFRSALMGFPIGFPELLPIEYEVVIVTAFGVLMPLVGLWLYRQAENKVRRDGTLAEY